MPNFAKDIKSFFEKRDKNIEKDTVSHIEEKTEIVSSVADKPKEPNESISTEPKEKEIRNVSEINSNTDTEQSNQEESDIKKEEVKDSSNEKNTNENSGEDNKSDTQSPKADETEPSNRSKSDYEKDRYVKQVEGEYLSQLTEIAKQASKQILNESVDTIIENLMYPKILKNVDDAFVELAIEEKVDSLIEKRINAYLSEELNSILPEIVNKKIQEEIETIISKQVEIIASNVTGLYCQNKFAEKFDEEIRKYLSQHQVSLDYLDNYRDLYIDISKLVKLIDDINLKEGKQPELENLLNNMLAKVLFQRERWIKKEKEKEKKLMSDGENENKDKEES